jgi:hypothetical protein
MSASHIAITVSHALVGWALCAAATAIGLAKTTLNTPSSSMSQPLPSPSALPRTSLSRTLLTPLRFQLPPPLSVSLEAAYKARVSFILWLGIDPHFAPLRDDPRYQDMARRIGLPQ